MTLEHITIGREARLKIGDATYCFARIENQTTREIVYNPDTICGDIDPPVNRKRKGRKIIRASLFIDFTPAILEAVVPWLGVTDLTGGVYELGAADDLVEKDVTVDFGPVCHLWSNCVVLGYAFRGSKGGRPCQMQVNIEGEDETEVSSFTDAPLAINETFSFTDISTRQLDNASAALTTRPIDRFLVQVDNRVVSEHNSSITRTGAEIGDRQGVFATSIPYITAHKDVYWNYRDKDGAPGVEAKLKLTNDDGAIEFFVQAAIPITKGHDILGKVDQIRTPVTFDLCRGDNAGTRLSPLKITLT